MGKSIEEIERELKELKDESFEEFYKKFQEKRIIPISEELRDILWHFYINGIDNGINYLMKDMKKIISSNK